MKGLDEKGFIEAMHRASNGGNAVFVDYDLYAHFLDDSDLTEEQKREVLQLLWNIVCEFVSLGWGVHPLQQALDDKEACGKPSENAQEIAVSGSDAVQWLNMEYIEQFAIATGSEEDRNGKDVSDGQI